ncbi:MAG: hypothetical protein H6577_00070 [Lewinellaceae bacterium]|nr:hypothetical protein [Saprospiraceae bacterium]MCB9336506.1 hypothetical protein [Lewinellaceae bacterium]
MKKNICILFLPFLLALTFQHPLPAASAKWDDAAIQQSFRTGQPANTAGIVKKAKTKKGWFSKLKAKLKSKFNGSVKKGKGKPGREKAPMHLYVCLGLVVLSIIMFALYSYGQVFSILGSVFAIGAAVFFVLWLLNFMGAI